MTVISYDQALDLICERVNSGVSAESVPFSDAFGRILAEPVWALADNPPFTNSAVDGYALFDDADLGCNAALTVCGEIAAGNSTDPSQFSAGTSARIFTGAPVPNGCVAIVMQEQVSRVGDTITLAEAVSAGKHIRQAGADFGEGDLLLPVGSKVNAGGIALLASQGITDLAVLRKPRTAILSTGRELVEADQQPGVGELRDSNTPMLSALLHQFGAEVSGVKRIEDSFDQTLDALAQMGAQCDLVLISGGASVGEYDFAVRSLAKLGDVFFHGVAIKPGKPVAFGKVDSAYVLCLPGNPASAFVCFQLFIRTIFARLQGCSRIANPWIQVKFQGECETGDREEFVRCQMHTGAATPVSEQGSFGIASLAHADCIVRVPAHTHAIPGTELRALLIND